MSTTTEAPARKRSRWETRALLAMLVATPFVCVAGSNPLPAKALLLGWLPYLMRLCSRVRYDLTIVVSAGLCLVALVVALHWVCSWLYPRLAAPGAAEASAGIKAVRWWPRWSIAIVGVLLLTATAGTAVLAIVHQCYWLATSPKPLIHDRPRERTWCAGNMRQIGMAILIYAAQHERRFPERLVDLCADGMLTSSVFVCPSSGDRPAEGATVQEWVPQLAEPGHLSYVYVGRGLTSDAPANRPILYEPLDSHDDEGANVLFADAHVEFIASRRGPDGQPVFGMELPAPATAPTTTPSPEHR